jgi:cytochrome c oxidase subunit 2
MSIGSVIIWLGTVGLTLYASFRTREPAREKSAQWLIVAGGIVFPTVLLAGLLSYGLSMLPDMLAPAPPDSMRILVRGEQWWWRVRYLAADGHPVDLANEICLPVGTPVEFQLESPDVIHSFWIPALGGKVDMIPGRQTRLRLEPTRIGEFRGVCAEYCGTSHALMGFPVLVLEKEDFARWLKRQAEPAHESTEPLAARGKHSFLASGCGACHTVRGTPADGVVGPDLTHVGSRRTLGAGLLANELDDYVHWLAHADTLKPDVHMPAFGMLPPPELRALAVYLESLQ